MQKEIQIKIEEGVLSGILSVPKKAKGIVLFIHGSGSSRLSPRNQQVANILNEGGVATLLFDLLTPEEEEIDVITRELRFDISMLSERTLKITKWVSAQEDLKELRIGYFGASTGAAAALIAASKNLSIAAVVSRGGRPDLALENLVNVVAPTLLIVGEEDYAVIGMNEEAYEHLTCEKELLIIEGATHLFEEPGKLEEVAKAALKWFQLYFGHS